MSGIKIVVVVVVLVLIGIPFTVGFVKGLTGSYEPTKAALDNSFKNGFISACSEEADNSVCVCAYDKLLEMYPDFVTNEARQDRILSQGYNSNETDAIVSCV